MSTILKAFEKSRSGASSPSDVEAILARNAAHRQAMRRKRPATAQKVILALGAVCLAALLLCMAAMTLIWTRPFSPTTDKATDVAMASEAPQAAATDSQAPPPPAAVEPKDTPPHPIRASLHLRAHPPSKPSVAADESPTAGLKAGQRPPAASEKALTSEAPRSPGEARPTPRPTSTPAPRRPGATAKAPERQPPAKPKVTPGPSVKVTPPPQKAARHPRDFLHLTGIIFDPRQPTALINDRIVSVGDTVEGAKVLAIDSDSSVRIEYEGKQYKLVLK